VVITDYVKEISGIVLDTSKSYLVESRLSPILEDEGLNSFAELYRKARADSSKRLRTTIIDAISTNETSFFRDSRPFDLLSHKLIPDIIEQKSAVAGNMKPSINIWCAASSTGQEIYSVAIVLKELLQDLSKYTVKIVGTDISDAALETASRGKYSKLEISRGMTAEFLRRHFDQDGEYFRISDELRSISLFKRINLMDPISSIGKFDLIMCRNVAIYFSQEDKKVLFDKLADQLNPDGRLLIGSTESLVGMTDRFKRNTFNGVTFYNRIK